MKKIISLVYTAILFLPIFAFAQNGIEQGKSDKTNFSLNTPSGEIRDIYPRKGKFFVFWGYNREAYTHSDIHFNGDGYDFSVTDIRAVDEPSSLSMMYLKPNAFTVPQFNIRAGYYLSDKNFISFGTDHMKYSMVKQTSRLTGTITKGINQGTYNNAEVTVGEHSDFGNNGPSIIDNLPTGFVSNFEHCDGLNDVSAEFGRLEQLWISKNKQHALSIVGSVCLGMVIPDSDVDVLGQPPKHDMDQNKKAYHLAGYSTSATMGLQFDMFNHIFILFRLKAGYMNLPDILTTVYGGKASQHFDFLETMGVVGYTFAYKHNKPKKTVQ